MLEGTVEFHVNGEVIPGKAGSVIRYPAGVIHATAPTGKQPARVLDVFSPIRQDYLYLTEYQRDTFA